MSSTSKSNNYKQNFSETNMDIIQCNILGVQETYSLKHEYNRMTEYLKTTVITRKIMPQTLIQGDIGRSGGGGALFVGCLLALSSSNMRVYLRDESAQILFSHISGMNLLRYFFPQPMINQVTPNLTPVSISGYDIPFSQSARNLGVFIDETLSMDVHIKYLCRILFCQLRRLGKIRPFLSTDAANRLAVSFILTRLDYCNSLLAGLPDNKLKKLQRIQNHGACIVLRKPTHASATSMLKTLHWLPVKARVQYKIACLYFQCLCHNTMPSYLSDILHPYLPPRTLHSLDTSLLTIPRFCLETYGRRSFSVFGPTVWNSLPLALRKTQCFSTFKKKLNTYLFEKHLC